MQAGMTLGIGSGDTVCRSVECTQASDGNKAKNADWFMLRRCCSCAMDDSIKMLATVPAVAAHIPWITGHCWVKSTSAGA